MEPSLPFDMLSPDFVLSSVPMIDRMHAEAPVFFDPRVNGWMVDGEILTSLVQAIEGNDTLTFDEIIDLAVFIMTGGYDTTTHLIASGLKLLLGHPEQLAAVRADPTKIDGWIEETLRFDPQIAINTRLVIEAFEHEGHRFEPGQIELR